MAKTEREPLLVGVMLCMASLVGLGLLLTMPAYDNWQQSQAQQQKLTADVTGLSTENLMVDADILKLSRTPNLPKDIFIRQSSPLDTKKHLKAMLDELIRTATTSGNQLISLLPGEGGGQTPVAPVAAKPVTDPKAAATPPADAKKDAGAQSNPADTTNQTGSQTTAASEPAPAVPTLQTFPYELAFRGNFDQVLTFLAQLNHHRELVEVTQVELKNEGGPQRQDYTSTNPYNRAKPIALKMNLRLVLEPSK